MELGELGFCGCEVSSFLMGFLENNHVTKMLFFGQTHFEKLYMNICFLKSVVLWPYYILLYMEMHYFGIAFGEMHELLIWKNEHLLFNLWQGNHGFYGIL